MTDTTLSQYRILEELGRGGMGIVYKAEDTKLERQVALKVLPAAALASEDDRARFYREAKAAAALNHPNIAQVYQIDEAVPSDAPHGTEPSPFIAMEFIEGGTLEDRIKAGPLKLAEAVRIATQTAEALKAAHAKDIVHRDIKSANIMLTTDGQAKVLDFGLAQTSASTKLTRMGSTLGTVAYMSPEQARGEEVDGRTDLWALGVTLYEMISGVNPFGGDYEQAVIYSILNTDPEPLTALRTGVPMELERITNKLLAKEASRRYQTAVDLIADLGGVNISSGSRSAIRTSTHIAAAPTPSNRNRPGQTWWAISIGLALSLAALAWFAKPTPDTLLVSPVKGLIPLDSSRSASLIQASQDGSNLTYTSFKGGVVSLWHLDPATGKTTVPFDTEDIRWISSISPEGDKYFTHFGDQAYLISKGGVPSRVNARRGGKFLDQDRILFAQGDTLSVLNTRNDASRVALILNESDGLRDMQPLDAFPDGQSALILAMRGEEPIVLLVDLKSGVYHTLIESSDMAWYVRGDFVVYQSRTESDRAQPLVARRLDEKKGRLVGPVLPVLPAATSRVRGRVAVSDDHLFWVVQNDITSKVGAIDEEGKFSAFDELPVGLYHEVHAVPGSTEILMRLWGEGLMNTILEFDVESLALRELISLDSRQRVAVTPDGQRVWYPASPTNTKIVSASLDPADAWEPQAEIDSTFMNVEEIVFRPDGRQVIIGARTELDRGLWLFDLEKGFIRLMDKYETYLSPRFSPSGELLAYGTGYGDERRLFVEHLSEGTFWEVDFPQVSEIEWDPDGNWLYVRGGSSRLFRIPIDLSAGFRVTGSPEPLGAGAYRDVAVLPEGGGLIGSRYAGGDTDSRGYINVIAGFPEWLEREMTALESNR